MSNNQVPTNNQEPTNDPLPPREQQDNQDQNQAPNQPQDQDQQHTNEDTVMEERHEAEATYQSNAGIYASRYASPPTIDEQASILKQRVEDSMRERFQQDNATASVRKARKRRHEEALEDLKAFIATQQALNPSSEREVVPRNMPGLQVLGGPIRFEDKDMHESIAAFFTAFKAQLHSEIHKLNLDNHWERLFWQCLDNHQRSWFQRELHGRDLTWKQAQKEIETEYGNPCHIWQKGQELYELRQQEGQPIREYVELFESLAREAARMEDDRLCKDFIYSLHDSVRGKLYQSLASNYPKRDPTNLHEVALLAIRTLGEHMETTSTNRQGKRQRVNSHHSSTSEPKSRRKYGNCPVHKHGSHNKEECSVLRRLHDATQQQPNAGYLPSSSSKNSGTASGNNTNICKHCRKVPFTFDHLKVCPEYQAKRQDKNNIHNRSIAVTNTASSRADEIYDFCAGQLANMDITGKYTCYSLQDNTSDSLFVALTVQTENILALVDTGANRSFITPSLAQSINAVINKDILDHTHVSLAQNGSSATLLGLAQNVSLTYNGKELTHDFLVMELSGTAPVTIGLDLMPKLGIAITGLAATWQQQQPKEQQMHPNDIPQPNDSPAGSDIQRHAFFSKVQPTIDRNAEIHTNTFCTVPQSVIKLNTKDEDAVVHRRQYPIPIASQQRVKEQVETWLRDGVVEPVTKPTMWNSPITLAPKKDLFGNYTDKRPLSRPTPYQQAFG